MPTKSVNGNTSFALYTDDFSGYLSVYGLSLKSRQPDAFRLFRMYAERVHKRRISTLRTDNGGEFMSTSFEKELENLGIEHECSTPYTPQSNGVSERGNRTLLAMVRVLLE